MRIEAKTEGQYHETFEEIFHEALCIHLAIFEGEDCQINYSKSGSFAAGYLLAKLGNNWEAIALAKNWIRLRGEL
jgi:hypothetical protein